MNIDFQKYKRFFSFGCSFTNYIWPSWADIIAREMPNADFYNLGMSGMGNLGISARITEANHRYNFTEHDLIMVMFSSYTREDRFVKDYWMAFGNVYNNPNYDRQWIEKYADQKGYLIRDLSLLDMITTYLNSLDCDNCCMISVPFVTESDNPSTGAMFRSIGVFENFQDINKVYHKIIEKFPKSLCELEFDNNWSKYQDYDSAIDGGHPSSLRYFNYLKNIGINLSNDTYAYAKEWHNFLAIAKSRKEVIDHFEKYTRNKYKGSWPTDPDLIMFGGK